MPRVEMPRVLPGASLDEVVAALNAQAELLEQIVMGYLDGDNLATRGISTLPQSGYAGPLDEKYLSFTTHGTANTEFEVVHGLGRVPRFFSVVSNGNGGVLYKSKAFDGTKMYFKCTSTLNAVIIRAW